MSTQTLFQKFYHNPQKLSEAELAELKNCHILFIPGIFSKFIHLFVGKYFHPQIKFLKHHGITNYSILWNTELSCEGMSTKIKEVADKHDKLMVVTHSKGGIDFLTFLVQYPQYNDKIKGWLCMQAPIWGSKFADMLYSYKAIRYVFNFAVVMYGGECKAGEQLTTSYRRAFMHNHKDQIQDIVERKNIIFLSSSIVAQKSPYAIPLFFGKCFFNMKKIASDGLVSPKDAGIGGIHIHLNNVDHATTVLPAKQKYFSNYRATRACFRTLLTSA